MNYPHSLTILPTYRCTASCKECCFESTPKLKTKLKKEEIFDAISQAKEHFPALRLIVFSGGECFTLKSELYESIGHASSLGLGTRCVSNGYWGENFSNAEKVAKQLQDNQLTEINFSTGLDHQKFVSEEAILNCVKACSNHGVYCLVTVEKDTDESNCYRSLLEHDIVNKLIEEGKLKVVSNTWMPFQAEYVDRGKQISMQQIEVGCDQVFENLVITPHGRISGCCGLTFEHIPEMKIGEIGEENALKVANERQLKDFLKIWLKVDGPVKMIKKLMPEGFIEKELGGLSHACQACAFLHKDERIKNKVKETYKQHLPDVMFQFNAQITEEKMLKQEFR